ncbi:MAG: gluconate 2-dehydrogenase subunit 3 family protein, partial [Acidobacteria bacterium]|nr:gluconate 2-dehydrogenase subunit 3 family protein [Acidobacteriota bacterium]
MDDWGLAIAGLSRRELLKLAASAATVPCAISVGLEVAGAAPVAPAVDAGQAAGVLRAPLQALTATEADLLDAIVARLIPTDAGGPGASEAGAVRYIDRALAGALVGSREAYRTGLAALDRYA